jgi:hypothetical protein
MRVILIAMLAIIGTIGLGTTTTIVQAQAGSPGCPDPGWCTCNTTHI